MNRTPVFSAAKLDQVRTQLAAAAGAADYWKRLTPLRTLTLLGTIRFGELARAAFGSDEAAIRGWGPDLPETADLSAVGRVINLLLQLDAEEQRAQQVPHLDGVLPLLQQLEQETIPQRLSALEQNKPLVIVLRGIYHQEQSLLAEVIFRAGFAELGPVELLPADAFLVRIGRDSQTKQSVYRIPGGNAVAADPLQSRDPIRDVKQLLWQDDFGRILAAVSAESRMIVMDGGYNELLLDEAGVTSDQRLVVEVNAAPTTPAAHQTSEDDQAAARRELNTRLTAFVWHTLVCAERAPADITVTISGDETLDALVKARSAQLGREPREASAKRTLLLRLNFAKEPEQEALSAAKLDALLQAMFTKATPQTLSVLLNSPLPSVHGQLPAEIQKLISVPQLQILVEHYRRMTSTGTTS